MVRLIYKSGTIRLRPQQATLMVMIILTKKKIACLKHNQMMTKSFQKRISTYIIKLLMCILLLLLLLSLSFIFVMGNFCVKGNRI